MTIKAEQAISDLISGNNRFCEGLSEKNSANSLNKLREFAQKGQTPKAIVLCCSDSRAPVETVFDQDIGDLFVIRVAGNIIAPSLIGSVEFAVSAFETKLVVVMGHTRCGAIKATLDHIQNTEAVATESIHDIISRIKPHIFTITKIKDVSYEDKLDLAVEANVLASVSQLSHASRMIEGLVNKGGLKIVGAVLELDTGKVNFLE
jgi:carbonic anhydrase